VQSEEKSSKTAAPLVRGYAALFNTKSSDLGGFIERIAPHAFDGVDLEDGVVALFNHDPSLILARSGGLRLGTDKRGLWYEFTPPNSPNGQNLAEALRRGDITQSSFGFSIRSDDGEEWDWVEDEEGREHAFRTIKKIARLYDVSPVTYPAYPDTSVAARHLEAVQKQRSKAEGRGSNESPANNGSGHCPPEAPAARTAKPPALTAAQRVRLGLPILSTTKP